MSWLKQVTSERVVPALRRYDSSVKATLSYKQVELDAVHNGFTYEYAHRTRLVVESVWYANQAQFEGRAKLAERAIVELVFEPYTKIRHRLLHAVYDGDRETTIELLSKMEKEMGLE